MDGSGLIRPTNSAAMPKSIVRYEDASTSVSASRRGVIFATEHDFDDATQLFMRPGGTWPLADGENTAAPAIWKRQKFSACRSSSVRRRQKFCPDGRIARPSASDAGPARQRQSRDGVLPGDVRQRAAQGKAVVCQDWIRSGAIGRRSTGSRPPTFPDDARLQGMIHFFFACHGGGCTEPGQFRPPEQVAEGKSPRISRSSPACRKTETARPSEWWRARRALAHVERQHGFIRSRASAGAHRYRVSETWRSAGC